MNRRKLVVSLIVVLSALFGLAVWRDSIPPKHVLIVGGYVFHRQYKPEPGYTWVANPPTQSDLRIRWTPGVELEDYPHIVAAEEEGNFLPAAGYDWVVSPPTAADTRVKWTPGSRVAGYPHVMAAEAEGSFVPDAGYAWVVTPPTNADLRVKWTPGIKSAAIPHVMAAEAEGSFLPEPGYAWVVTPPTNADLRVQWTPGMRLTQHPHIAADTKEGVFDADEGYRFVTAGSLDVTWVGVQPDSGSGEAPDKIDWASQIARFGIYLLAEHYSQPDPDDSAFVAGLVKPAIKLGGDSAKRAFEDGFKLEPR